jgi:hypothetical protein
MRPAELKVFLAPEFLLVIPNRVLIGIAFGTRSLASCHIIHGCLLRRISSGLYIDKICAPSLINYAGAGMPTTGVK